MPLKAKFDLNLLSFIVALHDKRNLSETAKTLGMSQPAASVVLARLRKTFHDELFIRTGGEMVPTPRAEALIRPAREVMLRVNQELLTETPFDPKSSDLRVGLSLTEICELVHFPAVQKSVQALAPRARIESVLPSSSDLVHGLENGEIDLAIGIFPELDRKNFCRQSLLVTNLMCIMRKEHPFRGGALTLPQYLKLRHVEYGGARRKSPAWPRMLRAYEKGRDIAITTWHAAGLPQILLSTDIVATVPRTLGLFFCRSYPHLKLVSSPFSSIPIAVRQYWPRRLQDNPKNRWLRQVVRKAFDEQALEYTR